MKRRRPYVPIGLPIAMVLLFALGRVWVPLMSGIVGSEALETELLLIAAPFLLTFIAIVLAFISITWLAGSVLNNNVPARICRPIELGLIGGIAAGIIGLFQPWTQVLYQAGFHVLLVSTIGFIFWSHIVPAHETFDEELDIV